MEQEPTWWEKMFFKETERADREDIELCASLSFMWTDPGITEVFTIRQNSLRMIYVLLVLLCITCNRVHCSPPSQCWTADLIQELTVGAILFSWSNYNSVLNWLKFMLLMQCEHFQQIALWLYWSIWVLLKISTQIINLLQWQKTVT